MLQRKGTKDTEVRVAKDAELEKYLAAITGAQYRDIIYTIEEVVNGNTTFGTEQMKGHEWDKKVFAPLLEATANNEAQMEELLELIVMDYLIHRPDKTWSYHREERDRLGQAVRDITFEVEAVTPA